MPCFFILTLTLTMSVTFGKTVAKSQAPFAMKSHQKLMRIQPTTSQIPMAIGSSLSTVTTWLLEKPLRDFCES